MPENLTKQEMLNEINNAIYAILVGGQSYKIGSRSLTRANITELKNLRAEIETELAQETETHLMDRAYVAFFDGR